MSQPGDNLLHYRLLEQLGQGGGGVVWRALDTRLNREVAIKFLSDRIASTPGGLSRLEQEARALAALNHPNIVTVYAVEEAGDLHFLAMELVRGRMLDSLIPEKGLSLELRKLADVFVIQEEIARSIADALKVTLSRSEHEALGRPSTSDVEAYDQYLRGRKYYYQYRRRGVQAALEMFERAIEMDPSYARAWAGVADCHCFFYLYVARTPEHIQQAEAASRKALDLNPHLAEAQASWGLALVRLYEEAEAIRPEDYQCPTLVAQIYGDLGQTEKVIAAHRRGLRRAEETLKLLERAVERGLTHRGWFEHDSNLDPLRQHPRFKALLERL